MAKRQKILFFAIFSLLNCLYGVLYLDFYLFLFRQVFITCAFSFTFFYDKEVEQFSKDYIFINTMLSTKYSLLKLETPLMFLSCCSVFIFSNVLTTNHFLYVVSGLILGLYFLLLIYRFICIYRTPEVRVYYQLDLKNKRRFSTTASLLKVCAECGRFVGFGFVASYGVPKAIFGADYRSPVVNLAGYLFTGYKSDSEMAYSIANHYFSDKASRAFVTEADGITISKKKLYTECLERNYPVFLKTEKL